MIRTVDSPLRLKCGIPDSANAHDFGYKSFEEAVGNTREKTNQLQPEVKASAETMLLLRVAIGVVTKVGVFSTC